MGVGTDAGETNTFLQAMSQLKEQQESLCSQPQAFRGTRSYSVRLGCFVKVAKHKLGR